MRLSPVLRKQHLGWWFKKKWETQRNRKILGVKIPEKLTEKGIEIVDAVEYTKQKKPFVKYTISEPWNFCDSYEKVEEHPDWHEKSCYLFRNDSNLLEGEKHVQNLTKTLIIKKLPKSLQDIYDKLDVSSLDELAQNCILNSLIHDAYQIKLPKIIDKERPWYVFRREYGIPLERKIFLLHNSLIRLGDLEVKEVSDVLNRDILYDAKASAPLEKEGDFIQFRVEAPICIVSRKELTPFADENEVLATLENPLPDIYPIKSILDLKQENLYKIYDFFPVKQHRKRFLHTLLLPNLFSPDDWSHSQLIARAIGVCHGFAVAQAKHLYGNEVANLPHPVNVQCIQSNSQHFDFVAYQLNTFNLDGVDGVKNLAWVDDGHKLFEKCEKVDGNIFFDNFNNDVIRRFLTFYYNGLKT